MIKSIFTAALCIIFAFKIQAQVPRFEKINIGSTGCAVYVPAPIVLDSSFSEDSSIVFSGEAPIDSFSFFVICVQFKDPIGNDKAANTDLLTTYMDFLQQSFSITANAGYGKGHSLDSAPDATGVIDYWTDEFGLDWTVKGWINNGYLAVLGIYGRGQYPVYNVQDMFLNGFRFPE